MTPEHRLELLKLTKPATDNPDIGYWIRRATELEAWVNGAAGQPETAQPKAPPLTLPEARNTRQSSGPALRK